MDLTGIQARLEAALGSASDLAGGDPAVDTAAVALLETLGPALRQALVELAEQAAIEVGAQLPDHHVEVVMTEGEPSLQVRADEAGVNFSREEAAARLTVRLPSELKSLLEDLAAEAGDSINSYVIKSLSSRTSRRSRSGRMKGTIET